MTPPTGGSATRHGSLEDGYALVVGSILIALGLSVLHAAGLVTGGTAGLALIVGHWVGWPSGVLFAFLNLPFIALALRGLGSLLTVRTILGSACIALLSTILERSVGIIVHDHLVAAIAAGTLLGMGTLAFVRHGTGVGGIGLMTIWLNRWRGWNMGTVQISLDVTILAVSTFFLTPEQVGWSALCAIVMGVVVALWHRPDRYLAMSPWARGNAKFRIPSDATLQRADMNDHAEIVRRQLD